MDSSIKQIGKDVLYYTPAKIIPIITSILGIALYTRLLDPKEFGWYSLIIVTVSFVYAFSLGWVGYVVWRYFERYKNEQKLSVFLSTVGFSSAMVFVIIAILWYLVTMSFFSHLEAHFMFLLRIGILVLGAQLGFSFILTVLQVNRQSLKYGVFTSVNALGTLALAAGLIYFLSWEAEGILWASVIFMGGISALELSQFYKRWRISPFHFSGSLLKSLAMFGLPQIGISIGSLFLSIIDRYMIEAMRSTEEVGIYSAGYHIADLSIQIPLGILTLAALPVIIQTFENKGEEETRQLFKRLFTVYLLMSVPSVFGITVLSENITKVILGQSYWHASVILPWVAAGVFFFGFTQYSNAPFQLKERPLFLLYLILMAGILNIILNFILIPPLGILGAAYATFIAYFIYFAVSYLVVKKFFRLIIPWQTLIKSVIASIGMGLILHFGLINLTSNIQNLILSIAIGGISYFIILIILREQTVWKILKQLKQVLKSRF